MSAYINGYDIIESNTLITEEEEKDLFVDMENKGEVIGTLHFVFVKEEGESEIVSYVENDQLIIKMVNFYDTMERFSLSPIEIGTLNESRKIKLLIMSCVRGDTKKIRITTYTLFLEKEGTNEGTKG